MLDTQQFMGIRFVAVYAIWDQWMVKHPGFASALQGGSDPLGLTGRGHGTRAAAGAPHGSPHTTTNGLLDPENARDRPPPPFHPPSPGLSAPSAAAPPSASQSPPPLHEPQHQPQTHPNGREWGWGWGWGWGRAPFNNWAPPGGRRGEAAPPPPPKHQRQQHAAACRSARFWELLVGVLKHAAACRRDPKFSHGGLFFPYHVKPVNPLLHSCLRTGW